MTTAELIETLTRIRSNAVNIMGCNGYKCRDGMGTENSEWLGPRLHAIVDYAQDAINKLIAEEIREDIYGTK